MPEPNVTARERRTLEEKSGFRVAGLGCHHATDDVVDKIQTYAVVLKLKRR